LANLVDSSTHIQALFPGLHHFQQHEEQQEAWGQSWAMPRWH